MTSTVIEPRQVDSGRVDEGGRQWPIVLAVLIIGLVIGGLVGGVYGATRPTSYEASTALSVQPDPTIDVTSQNSNQNSTPTLDASAYIQSQLVIINGAQLADRVRDAENLPSRPDVTATQVGQTYVVDITASAASKSRAAAIARETGTQYIAERSSLLRAEIKSLLTSTSQQLKGVAASLTAQRSRSTTSPLTPSQTALQTEYERLLSVRSTLNAVSAQASQVVTVVSPARATDSSLSSTEKDLLGGAVIGAILALIVFLTLRRTVHRVRSVADLAALDVPVILPVQPKRSLRQARKREFWKSPQARLLAARCSPRPTSIDARSCSSAPRPVSATPRWPRPSPRRSSTPAPCCSSRSIRPWTAPITPPRARRTSPRRGRRPSSPARCPVCGCSTTRSPRSATVRPRPIA